MDLSLLRQYDSVVNDISEAIDGNELLGSSVNDLKTRLSDALQRNEEAKRELVFLKSQQEVLLSSSEKVAQLTKERGELDHNFVESSRASDFALKESKAVSSSLKGELTIVQSKYEAVSQDLEKERASKADIVASSAAKETELLRRTESLTTELSSSKAARSAAAARAAQLSEQLDATILALQQKGEEEAAARRDAESRAAALEAPRTKHEALLGAI